MYSKYSKLAPITPPQNHGFGPNPTLRCYCRERLGTRFENSLRDYHPWPPPQTQRGAQTRSLSRSSIKYCPCVGCTASRTACALHIHRGWPRKNDLHLRPYPKVLLTRGVIGASLLYPLWSPRNPVGCSCTWLTAELQLVKNHFSSIFFVKVVKNRKLKML